MQLEFIGTGESERRAGILCYITHTILQAQRAQAYCQKLADERAAAAESQLAETRLPLTWNLCRSPEDLARLAQHDPKAALAVIRAQCLHRLNNEEKVIATDSTQAIERH